MCNETEVDYDSEGYEKALDKLVIMSEKEYYTHLVDINRHQVIVAKTLLWLLIVIIGADVAFVEWSYGKVEITENRIPMLTPSFIFIGLSLLSAVAGFAYSSLAIPAFGGYEPLYKSSWGEYSNNAFQDLHKGSHSVYANTLTDILNQLDQACSVGNATNASRGERLRKSSYLSVAAIVLSAIAFIIFLSKLYL